MLRKRRAGKELIDDIKKYKLKPDEHLVIILSEAGAEFFVVKESKLRANDYKFEHNGVSYYITPTKNKHIFVKGDIRELDEQKLVKTLTEKNIVDPFLFKKTRPLIISEALSKTLGVESPISKYARANLFVSVIGFILIIGAFVISLSEINTLKAQTKMLNSQVQTLEKIVTLKNLPTTPQPAPHNQPTNNTHPVVIPPSKGGGG